MAVCWWHGLGEWGLPKSKVRRLYSAERQMLERRGLAVPEDGDAVSDSENINEILKELKGLKSFVTNGCGGGAAAPKAQPATPEISVLREQLMDLHSHIEETKREIASIRQPGEEEDRLTSAAIELGAIIDATEQATHTILNATEEIDDIVDKLRERSSDVAAIEMLGEVNAKTMSILEACNFQDISGQRTNKVINIINYLEQRILSMIDIWGAEGFAGIVVEDEKLEGDAALLQGPQMDGQGISQDDIDSMFD